MIIARALALPYLSLITVLTASRLQTSAAFIPSLSLDSHKTIALNKITKLFSQRSADTEMCPEIPTTPINPSNEIAVVSAATL